VNNKWKTSRVRTELKKLQTLMTSGDKDAVLKQFPIVQGLIARLAKSSALKKSTAARKTSRLAAKVSKL
jgi:small subunit ribosomal protein S20